MTASSATERISHVVLGQEERWLSRAPPQPRRQSHLPAPRFLHNIGAGYSMLAAWKVASCAQTVGGNPVTGRSNISVICKYYSGARSTEGAAHRPLLSIPRSQERTVERHLDVPCASVTCFDHHVQRIVAVLWWGQEQLGTRTEH